MDNVPAKTKFLNFSNLEDKEAKELVGRLTSLIGQAETDREPDVDRAEDAVKIYKNQLWSDEDIKFFEQFDMTPYQIPEGRAPINNLINQQRKSRYKLHVIPQDERSYKRHRKNRNKFVEEHVDEFPTPTQAAEWYDMYADDEMALAVSTYYDNVRSKNRTKYIESEAFENGVITGADFFKTIYSYKDTPDGRIKTERRSVRQMIWDRSSTDMMLRDVEYIGEVHRMYRNDLIAMFPEHREIIEDRFQNYTRMKGQGYTSTKNRDWKDVYKFDIEKGQHRLKVAEVWFQEIEQRYQVEHVESGDLRLVKYGLTEEQVWDQLLQIELSDQREAMERGEGNPELFQGTEDDIRQRIGELVEQKYTLRDTQTKTWVKVIMTHQGLLEYKRNPLPHESHPYTPFFAQFIDGWYSGVMDDIKDLLIALNKAVMFREVMMAHGAKGALIVDKKSLHGSDLSVDDLREMWTEIGGIIPLELKGGRRLSDVFQQVTTIGEGFAEITRVISELENKVYKILGVNQAMLGMMGSEAPASQIRQQIQQGTGNNGILFDNFNRALETHVHDKVIPLIMEEMLTKKPKAMRVLSEKRSKWIELTYDEEFETFVDAINSNSYVTRLETVEEDTQMNSNDRAMLMQMAAQSPELDVEAAIEFSGMNNAHEFLRRSRELINQKKRQMVADQVDLQKVQQMLLQQGIDHDQANEMINKLKLERMNELQERENKQKQMSQGMNNVQATAAEDRRMQAIDEKVTQQ